MYLKELTINGFKSFAKKGEFEFSSAITAIVGPNGSGKSNVAESFRFVLGEQSVKSMRGKKGEDLIWGGSEKIARGNRASVEVIFDNTNRTFALDFDEIKIERVVHRDGQNEYKINNSTVRLKDVHELLAGANIGSTGHHIISQGEADRVLSANPKERREMIEDALGLKVYQLKRQEADRKLAKTLENIGQVESLRREAAPHLRYLKKQVERAERSLEVQAQLKTTYAEYLKREDTYIARRVDTLTQSRMVPAEKLETISKQVKEAEKQTEATDATPADNEKLAAAKEAAATAVSAWQSGQIELSQFEGELSLMKRQLERSQSSTTKKLISYDALQELVSDIATEIKEALRKEELKSLRVALQLVLHRMEEFLRKEGHASVETSMVSEAEVESIEKKIATAKEQVATLLEKKEKAEAAVSALQTSRVSELEEKRNAEKELFSLLQQQRDLQSELRGIDADLMVLERDREEFKRELQEAVSLIGRSASDYFSYEIKDEVGNTVTEEQLMGEDRAVQRERRRNLEKLKIRLEELGVGTTDELMKEYEEAKARDEFLEKELADLAQSVENLNALITEMQVKLEEQFVAGVEKIAVEFNRFFTLMFGGGFAKLERVKIKQRQSEDDEMAEEEQVEEGVELAVSLPNKRVRGLDMLSGGERALTSIALIFAMSQVNPPPFIILDETDAALDEANSRRYGDMIEALAKKSQLVLITHNRETMSRAGILYGITMGADGVSKVLSVKFDEAVAVAK